MRLHRVFTVLFIFIMCMAIPTGVNADKAIIEIDHLNVRTGPGTHFDRISQVNSNEEYEIIQIESDWVEIQLENQTGWVSSEYITIEEELSSHENDLPIHKDQPNKTNSTVTSITISHENTQIRNGPSVDHEIIQFAKKDQEFPVVAEVDNWYEISISEGTGYVYKPLVEYTNLTVNHLKNKTIVIDAGHGGRDVGAIGINGTYEKSLTMKTTSELATTLKMLGANIILTRSNDDYIRLTSRAFIANLHDTDAFISIHYNSFTDMESVDGIDTYYYDDHDKEFAETIQREIVHETAANDRGVNFGNYQILRQSHQPSLLLELGFISNPEKEQLLLTNSYQEKLVSGITNGLIKHFSK